MMKPPAARHLDPWEHDEIFQGAKFTTLRKAAKYPKAIFDTILEEFKQTAANKSIMVVMKTNLKGEERGTAKAQAKFGGDVTQISDAKPRKPTPFRLFECGRHSVWMCLGYTIGAKTLFQ